MKTTPSHPVHTLGLDLGDKRHALCVLDAADENAEERKIPDTRTSLTRLARRYPGARLAMEVGSHSPWISRLLGELGLEVIVANARKLRAIYQNERKSDELDARTLARLARADVALRHPVDHISERSQRDNLVRHRVDIISAVRSTLKSIGIRLPSPNTSCFAKRARTLLGGGDVMTAKIRELDREIERLCEEVYPETRRLRQIRGVGPITALTFLLTIEDPGRFVRPRDVGAYLGLVPRRDQSGDSDRTLRISKCGNAHLRRLLVGSANYLLGPFGEDCDLRAHGLRLAERGGRGGDRPQAGGADALLVAGRERLPGAPPSSLNQSRAGNTLP